jgi:uncharacterized membrane protein
MISILDIIIPTNNKSLSLFTKIFFIILFVFFPFGIIFMLRGLIGPDNTWVVSVYLSIVAIVTVSYLLSITERITSIFFIGAVLILATAAGAIGLRTGYPFGHYYYSEYFIPSLPGGVPLAITLSWLIISINAFLICRLLIKNPKSPFIVPFAAAFIILAFDILLEPFGSFINKYWIWENSYVPTQNFISWYILGFMFTFMLEKTTVFIPTTIEARRIVLPVILLSVMIIQFAVINFAHGYWLYSLVGICTILAVVRSIKRKYKDVV